MAGKRAALAIKNTLDLSNVSQEGLNQYLLRTYQQQGPTFTRAVIDGFYQNGMIDESGKSDMLEFVNKRVPEINSTDEQGASNP